MKKTIIGIVVLAAIAAGAWYYTNSKPSTDVPQAQTTESSQPPAAMEEEKPAELAEGQTEYRVDTENSSLGWSARRVVGNSHKGTVGITSGSMIVDNTTVVSGEFTVDMNTITESNNNERFLTHIRSDDFFGIAQYPTARFVLATVIPASGENAYEVTGDLTIRDKTNTITFPATLTEVNGDMTVKAAFAIDRTRWDIVYDSGSVFLQLGDRAIRDEIMFDLNVKLERR